MATTNPINTPGFGKYQLSGSIFECIDAHTCGNPVRVVVNGGPALEGNNMSEKRQHFLREYDWIRKGLMFEPRGHDMMSGSILYPPHDPANDVAVLFIETSGCLPMCGHGTIGTITVAIEAGLIQPKVPGIVRMEAPAGLVQIEYTMEGDKVQSVKLTNVASYLAAEHLQVECPDLGMLNIDVCYGDRSPCGTGTSARLAHWFAKGKLKQGEPFKHESIIGSVFIGKIEQVTQLGEHQAIIPSIEGWAKIYGFNTIAINPKDDPYAKGFQVV